MKNNNNQPGDDTELHRKAESIAHEESILPSKNLEALSGRQAEEALRKNETTIKDKLNVLLEPEGDISTLNLADIIDYQGLQIMMEDFHQITKIGSAILDVSGKVLVAAGWQDICTKYHRVHPDTLKNCLESDVLLANGVPAGTFKAYRCKNNLWDMVTPIEVGGRHMGNIYLGQFLYEDEVPDYELFRDQARRYGFDETEYLAALDRVPHWSHETVDTAMAFCARLAGMISSLGYSTIKLSRALFQKDYALRQLEESEGRYRRIIYTANEGIWSMDTNHVTTLVNQKMADMLGWTPEEIIGKRVDYFMFDEDLDDHLQKMQERHIGYDHDYERRFRRKDGSVLWTIVSATSLTDESGVFCGSFAMFTDITERKKAEVALQLTCERLEEAQKIASIGDWEGNLVTGEMFWSQTVFAIFGVDSKSFRPSIPVFHNAIHPDDMEMVLESEIRSEQTGLHDVVHRIVRPNGEVRFIHELARRYNDDKGNLCMLRGTVQDITDRKRMEDVQVFLAQTSSGTQEEPFFEMLARYLAQSLGMDFVCIDRLEGDGLNARTVSVWRDGRFEDNVTYALKDTPCGDVVGKAVCCFPASVCQYFPRDQILQDLRAESYVGVTLWSHTGQPIGLIAVIGRSPLANRSQAESTLKLVAVRAAGELERIDAEAALRASLQRNEALLNAIPDMIFVFTAEGQIVDVRSDQPDELYLPPAEFLGKCISEVMPPDVAQQTLDHIAEAQQTKHLVQYTYTLEMNGEQEEYESRLVPCENGTFMAVVRNITEHKRAEAALRESEQRLDMAQHAAKAGVWDWNLLTGHIEWSKYMYDLFGLDPMLKVSSFDLWNSILHPDDRELAGLRIEKALTDQTTLNSDYRVIMPDGQIHWINAAGQGQYDAQGRPVRMIGICLDITERKQAEEALKENNELFSLFMQYSPVYTFIKIVTPTESRVVQASDNFRQMIGISGEDMKGKTMAELFPAEFAAKMTAEDWDVIDKGQVLKLDEELNGRFYTTIKFPIIKENKKLLAGYTIDITDQRRAEEEKIKLETQLQQAHKMESVGRLAGGVAHDFNNMLQVILNHTDVALEQVDPTQPLHESLEEIRKAAERSADLTRQLLAFARKQTVVPKVLDLNEIIENMLRMLHRLIGEDINLTWLPGTGIGPVRMDPSQIDQIMANLCVNARDAIAGVGKITIETGSVDFDEDYCAEHAGFLPGEYVRLTFSDDGCGMDKATLEMLFEPFFTTKEIGKGTGLGLATVYGIVRQNNGFINVYSEPGQGTTFTIYLPRYVVKTGQTQTKDTLEPALRGHETILLVEDEPEILKGVKRILETLGYRVLAASMPGEAIRLAKAHAGEIHLLITDVVMPEMNGRDLAKNLLSLYPYLKRLFMSGYTADIIAHHGVLDEGVHFIQKPFSTQNLAAKIRQALSQD